MGMFSDYRSLTKTTKEMQKNSDVKGRLGDMQSKMAALNSTMAQTVAGRATTEGVVATATVTSSHQTGAMINFAPACELSLLVMLPGRPPMPVIHTAVVPAMYVSRALPGQMLTVRVMPDDLDDLVVDWAAVS